MNSVTIFTDGSSRGNPGPGGWGAIIVGSEVMELGGAEKNTTNNRMEIMAAIEALVHTKNESILIYSDSSYVINGITKWVHGWKRNGWKTKTKDDVLNVDLWKRLDVASAGKNIEWKRLGGHVGIAGNERCDEIATAFAQGSVPKLYSGAVSDYHIKNILDISHDENLAKEKSSSNSRSKAKAYSYVSSVGGVIRTHRTWAECEKIVKGAKGARYKKALDRDEEEHIMEEFAEF